MGLYNTLIARVQCDNCTRALTVDLQFCYGDLRLYIYKIGDYIKWDENEKLPHSRSVKVYGIADKDVPCIHCGHVNDYEYDIWVLDNFIMGVTFMENYDDYLPHDGDYCVLEE